MNKILKCFIVIGALLVAHPHDFFAQKFVHPGGLATQDDFDRIQYLLNSEKDPMIMAAFNRLKANGHASDTYNPNAQERINRGGTDFPDNYSVAMNDVAAAFQNGLMWRITGDVKYANCAVRILNAWARVCKDITGDSNASLASGIYGYEFAQAGEILSGYSGWAAADLKAYKDWMRNLFYPRAMYFLELRHGHAIQNGDPGAYLSNWGLCNAFCVMSIGILCDDVAIYNQGLSWYKDDKAGNFTDEPRNPIKDIGYNEFLGNLVTWLHPDARGPLGYLGQMQESGRDQGHAGMAAGLVADMCQTALNQGDDLYAYMNNRIAAGFEYIALVNSLDSAGQVKDSVPFMPYERSGLPTENYTMTQNGLTGWGSVRPSWHHVLSYYEAIKGIPMHYSRKLAYKDNNGVDGGGGDYGGNSGGFDQLGYSTLISYRPTTWYPAAGHYPMTLRTSIIYKGNTIQRSDLSGVKTDSVITLSPSLPDGIVENGTWRWQTGETTRNLTFTAKKSGIYRVTYTSANGTKSSQAFNIAVWGDCTPDMITHTMTVGTTNYNDTVMTVLPFQSFSMWINTPRYNYGTAKWNTGGTGFSTTISNGLFKDSTFWVEHFNAGGGKTHINFHIKLQYTTPSISIDGGIALLTNKVVIESGQSVELKPVTTVGFDGGTFRWSTGHTAKNLMVLNIQKSKHYQLYYTLTKNNVTTSDTIDFMVSVKRQNYQLTNGDYFIQNATDNTYLTNTNANAIDKVKPIFNVVNPSNTQSQLWTISKETAADASGRFKIVSNKDGNYVNEKGNFGANAYYSSWNTYTIHSLVGENLFAIQNGGSSGTKFWTISGGGIVEGTTVQDGYPFIIKPVVPLLPDTTTIPGEGVVSYIAPGYSVNGGATQRGNSISVELGKNLILKPILVSGVTGGTWHWSDNSTNSTIVLNNVQNGGTYTVTYTYPEGDTVYSFTLKYMIMFAKDNYILPAGDYHIKRTADDFNLTNDGTLNPFFGTIAADTLSQLWTIQQDNITLRHKVVSKKDGRFLTEHGRFYTSPYDGAWNSYLFHYIDEGVKFYTIQNAGSSGSTYWAIEGDMINDRTHTTREGYPFKFELVTPITGVEKVSFASAKIYPNPVRDFVTVDVRVNTSSDVLFDLYSIDGRIVKSIHCVSGKNNINTADLPQGLYIGLLGVNGKIETFKINKK